MTGSNWRGNLGNTEESSRKGAGMQGHGKPPKNRAWNERLHMAREGRKRTRYVTRSGVGECPWHYYRDYTEIEYTGKRKNKREIQATRRVENLESTKEYKVSGQRLGKPYWNVRLNDNYDEWNCKENETHNSNRDCEPSRQNWKESIVMDYIWERKSGYRKGEKPGK